LAPRVLQQLGVLVDLPSHQGAKTRCDVAAQSAATNHEAEYVALGFGDAMARDERRGRDDHGYFLSDGGRGKSTGGGCGSRLASGKPESPDQTRPEPRAAPRPDSESPLTAASRTSPVTISCTWIGSPKRYRPL